MLAEAFGSELPASALVVPDNGDATAALAINRQIAAAQAFMQAGDWPNAEAAAKAATEIDPKRDLPWAWLANVYCEEASHASASADSLRRSCIQNYKFAIAIASNATYFNNLGAAYSALNQWHDAAENFRAAAQLNPDHAALYHQNLGTALLKQAEALPDGDSAKTLQSAAEEFSLAAASIPSISEANYWKGLCQLRLTALNTPGVTYAMAGESFQRYLRVAPDGRYASGARAMLEGLDSFRSSTVQTDVKK
jgi:tetratricopeptide (TPR) repeat protein